MGRARKRGATPPPSLDVSKSVQGDAKGMDPENMRVSGSEVACGERGVQSAMK